MCNTKCPFFFFLSHQPGFILCGLKQMRATCKEWRKGCNPQSRLGTFQLWDRAHQCSKCFPVQTSAWGSSGAPNNLLCAVCLVFCPAQHLNNCSRAALPETTLLGGEWIYTSFLHDCRERTGLMPEICSVLKRVISNEINPCQYFTLLSKKSIRVLPGK